MRGLFTGFGYLMDGFSLMFAPSVRIYLIIPICLNLLIFVGLFFLAQSGVHAVNAWLLPHLPSWLAWLATLIWILFVISFFAIFIYTYSIVANIVTAPFNSFLSERVQKLVVGNVPEERSFLQNVVDVPRIIGRQILILFYYLPRALLLLILFFVPLVQVIAPALWIAFHAWNLALTYLDYPADNNRIGIKPMRIFADTERSVALGFGGGVLLLSLVPVLNCFVIPAAVAGATKWWVLKNYNRV